MGYSARAIRRASSNPRLRWALAAFVFALSLSGCADCRFLAERCPQPIHPDAATEPRAAAAYRIGCPDVLAISFADTPDWNVLAAVDLDGRLKLESPGTVPAEGRTLNDVRADLARLAGVAADRVGVDLAAARSSRIFIQGPIRGRTDPLTSRRPAGNMKTPTPGARNSRRRLTQPPWVRGQVMLGTILLVARCCCDSPAAIRGPGLRRSLASKRGATWRAGFPSSLRG